MAYGVSNGHMTMTTREPLRVERTGVRLAEVAISDRLF